MTRYKYGQFCEVYGKTLTNLLWEHVLCFDNYIDVGFVAKEIGISRPKAYKLIYEFLEKKYLVKQRMVGKTQLYRLNKEHPIVKIHLRNFRECGRMVVEKYKKPATHITNGPVGVISTKSI